MTACQQDSIRHVRVTLDIFYEGRMMFFMKKKVLLNNIYSSQVLIG